MMSNHHQNVLLLQIDNLPELVKLQEWLPQTVKNLTQWS
jgi:hypothetical protein